MIILVLNGPNLNLLGTREVNVYGEGSYEQLCDDLEKHATSLQVKVIQHQSNYEGQLIDWIHEYASKVHGIVINPGGLTHTSVSLRDALVAVTIPFVEVHLSNIYAREPFRRHSYLADIAVGQVCGFGHDSYLLGLSAIVRHIQI